MAWFIEINFGVFHNMKQLVNHVSFGIKDSFVQQTSPTYARVAAMTSMQTHNFETR